MNIIGIKSSIFNKNTIPLYPLKQTTFIIVYTDGSYHPPTRWGSWCALIQIEQQNIILEACVADTSQHQMELTAVIQALQYIHNAELSSTIHIVTDSQYVADLPKRRIGLEAKKYITKAGKFIAHAALIKDFFYWSDTVAYTLEKVKAHDKNNNLTMQHYVDHLCRKKLRDELKKLG
jgi:ribonuclease HI